MARESDGEDDAPHGEYPGFILARAALLAALILWGLRIARFSVADGEMGSSFMHLMLLPFHEAGHVLFMPFGNFMHVAGGTIGQLLMPLILAFALYRKNHDSFGAAVGLWWLAMSLIDVAPYAWDASAPVLTLLGGGTGEDGGHDWIEMLGSLGYLERAHAVGRFFHHTGVLVMVIAVAWGAWALLRLWSERER